MPGPANGAGPGIRDGRPLARWDAAGRSDAGFDERVGGGSKRRRSMAELRYQGLQA